MVVFYLYFVARNHAGVGFVSKDAHFTRGHLYSDINHDCFLDVLFDFMACNRTTHCTGQGCHFFTGALTDLISQQTSSNTTRNHPET